MSIRLFKIAVKVLNRIFIEENCNLQVLIDCDWYEFRVYISEVIDQISYDLEYEDKKEVEEYIYNTLDILRD